MSLLYKDREDVCYFVDVTPHEESVLLTFYCDGGKFGTDELLDEIEIPIKELLELLQKHYNKE